MEVNRRQFIWSVGLGTAAGLSPHDSQAAQASNSDDWLAMLTDLSLCVGCRKCEWACKDVNGLPNQPIETFEDKSVFEHKRRTTQEAHTVVNRFPPTKPGGNPVDVKIQCMHCIEPACASSCLVKALKKTPDGPVIYDETVCIGCRYCMVACPFLIPTYTYDEPYRPVVRKCSMCFERVTKEGKIPACAGICPVEAITFGKRKDLIALARKKIQENPTQYVDHIYGEHEVGGTSWLYVSPKPFEDLGFPTNLGTIPYPELTKGFLSSVPLVLTIWPAMLMGCYAFTKRREELTNSIPGEPDHE